MNFPEELLHFVWQFRLYNSKSLHTTTGDELLVIRPGTLNKNAGPDFSNAKLMIAGTTWIGNIEIHLKSSDWLLHQHHKNEAYENVVLHVVYEDDIPIYRRNGTLLPVLVLKDLFPPEIPLRYEQLLTSIHPFPCEKQLDQVEEWATHSFLSRLLVERMVLKSEEIEKKLINSTGDWNAVFYHFIAKNFGFKVNALPMEMLAQSLPYHLFAKHRDNPLQVSALIFGQAGLLNQKFVDDYPRQLKREYQFLKRKYQLCAIDVSLWKFMRMRPQNFPTLRLAQFAALMTRSNQLFSKMLDSNNGKMLAQLFENLPVHPFWETHYHFNKKAVQVSLQLGKSTIESLLINTISICLFSYGKITDQYHYVQQAIELLENLPAENNSIIEQYANAGVKVNNAFYSQALLQLKKSYCNEKKCLNCGIGLKILKP